MSARPAADCRNLTIRYGHVTAVDDLSLQVRSGETIGSLGPDGAGNAGKIMVVRISRSSVPSRVKSLGYEVDVLRALGIGTPFHPLHSSAVRRLVQSFRVLR